MGKDQLSKLQKRLRKQDEQDDAQTLVFDILDAAREFGSLEPFIGADYEVLDAEGKVIRRIRKKAMSAEQLNTILKTMYKLRKRDQKALSKK